MENFTVLFMIFFCIVAFILMAFAVFVVGFLTGYKIEDKRIRSRKYDIENKTLIEDPKEEKSKKDWKRFLEYDGSTPYGKV